MTLSPVEIAQVDAVLRLIDREIWVLTAADGKRRGGLVATWVSAASIDPTQPVLLAGIAPNHFTAELVQASRAFAAHLLRQDQVDLAWNLAKDSGRDRDKLAGLSLVQGMTGTPLLADCIGWCDCRVIARYDAGDRWFFWGKVVAGTLCVPLDADGTRSMPATIPLREQEFFRRLNNEQRQHLLAAREADIAIQRPLGQAWRISNPW